ncbi:MAG TPA: hypothetical protein VM364_00035 [Vicinamibacterales bacterium]|nr:hypothetical protein [Vicinamibacterales bacterium]
MNRACIALLALLSISCGDMVRQGTASSYLILTSLEAASGAEPGQFGGTLSSDVITVTDQATGQTTIFADLGRATFRLALKDPGAPVSPNSPSLANAITINRYRVRFIRADGRNTPGVDVPYAFDGAVTLTVTETGAVTFTLVRAQAKAEPPLAALARNFLVLSTIAEVTFYGHDQTGREVITTGNISVNFANWGDPE